MPTFIIRNVPTVLQLVGDLVAEMPAQILMMKKLLIQMIVNHASAQGHF